MLCSLGVWKLIADAEMLPWPLIEQNNLVPGEERLDFEVIS
jgi:hypothetical protein